MTAVPTAAEVFEAQRHAAEVARVVRLYRTEGKKAVTALLDEIEAGKRGKTARDRLEADALKEILG